MVNVFIPLSDPIEIAKVLDDKRLGKQRVEAKQIITIIDGEAKSIAWSNHPAVLMWKGYSNELKYYYDCIVLEWIRRGYVNNMPLFATSKHKKTPPKMPWFMYCKPVIMSHQASLLRKNYSHYHKYFKSKTLKPYMTRSYLWVVESEQYLTAEKIKHLKAIVENPKLANHIDINEYTRTHEFKN